MGEHDFPAVAAMGGCTATLVNPLLVVYAAHCGTATADVHFGAHADTPERTVATQRCSSFPNTHLGDGTDLAYCILAEPVLDIEPERILAGCELEDFKVGDPAIVVGFGIDEQGGVFGEKRAAELPVSSLGDEMFLARGSADTCRGDSGGPVFAERREPDGGRQRRLVGVTSVGTDPVCGRGIGHYINLTRKVDWLEEDSQLDVTPCFDHGAWSPTAECLATRATLPAVPRSITDSDAGVAADPQVQDAAAARDASSSARRDSGATHVEADSGVEENPVEVRPAIDQSIAIDQHDAGAPSASGYLASCGPAFAPKQDDEAPKLKWTSPSKSQLELSAPSELGYAELDLEVAATDDGWGVKQVRLTLLDDHGQVLFERIDEVAPYGIPVFHVPLGVFTLRAETTDYAGNRSQADVALRIIGEDAQIMGDVTEPAATGCSYTSRARGSGWVLGVFALCVASSLRRRRGCRQP